jgi:hypothetical protein
LWFGVSCFYCAVPQHAVVDGAHREIRERSLLSVTRVLLTPLIHYFRVLRALDTVLMLGFAGTYLASGLVVLVTGWAFWAAVSRALA